jgi:small subunit ribosomal protein S16
LGANAVFVPVLCPTPQLGTYDPIASRLDGVKEIRVKVDRVKYWLSVGAQPSDTVARLLGHVGLLPPPPIRFQPKKSLPRKEEKRQFSTVACEAPAAAAASGSAMATLLGRPMAGLRPAFMSTSASLAVRLGWC